MTWFTGNTIDWNTSDEKIKKAFLELTGAIPDLTNKALFHTEERYLHDVMYPNCTCTIDYLATEEEYRALNHQTITTAKGLF